MNKATVSLYFRFNKNNAMKIENNSECNFALNEITDWLKLGEFNKDSYSRIKIRIREVEDYMGIPLPAKGFIESNCIF